MKLSPIISRFLRHSPLLPKLAFIMPCISSAAEHRADLIVYGGTSAAVIAAVQATKDGLSVVVVSPDKHLGGLSSGGLGFTDTGDKSVIGGLSRDFYHRIWAHYDKEAAWKWQEKASYGNKGQGTPAIDGEQRTMWIFEPHAAEAVFESYLSEFKLKVLRDQWLDRSPGGVEKEGTRITAFRTLAGDTFKGKVFMDATYEGDLMAAAGVSYHVGRESNATYQEQHNGNQVGVLHHRHHFAILPKAVSPYKVADDPKSGLLPLIDAAPPGTRGEADARVQAYCFRVCMTNHPGNRIPWRKPEGYDADRYELLRRVYAAGMSQKEYFVKFDPIPNKKTDTNNHGPVSSDFLGANYTYPEASYEERRRIIAEHRAYQEGLLYFLSTDAGVPKEVRERISEWGLPKDEFTDNGGWPHQLYIREARRMIGGFVMTENELLNRKPTPDSIGMGSYTIDSHNVRRYVTAEGTVQNEGDIEVKVPEPYEIAMSSVVPKREQSTNLLVPVCVSSSHIAFGSIRMEPVFMILGQSAASMATLAVKNGCAVQDVRYADLKPVLEKDGQLLELPKKQ